MAGDLAQTIDHTLLKPEATFAMITKLCSEAVEYGFHAICINPCFVPFAVQAVAGTSVKVCSVAGFPLGATTASTKRFEVEGALKAGASEIDMVLNTGLFLNGNFDEVTKEIEAITRLVHETSGILKVIIETGILKTPEHIVKACELCASAGADFVKTCTGFGTGEATVDHIRLMKGAIPSHMAVKASGGIRDAAKAKAMLDAGATRIGTSSGVSILQGLKGSGY